MSRHIEFDDDFLSFMDDADNDVEKANALIDSIYAAQTEHFGNGFVGESDDESRR